jgi:hypothetical protein
MGQDMFHLHTPIVLVHGLFGNLQDSRILSAFGQVDVHAPDLIGNTEARMLKN